MRLWESYSQFDSVRCAAQPAGIEGRSSGACAGHESRSLFTNLARL